MSDAQQHPGDRKTALRRRLITVRRSRSVPDRLAAASANAAHLLTLLADLDVVCGYLPLPSEPLAVELLDHLNTAGVTVLVPVVTADAALDWCRHPGPTEPGAFGIAEPSGPRLGATAVRTADAILVPALAVDLDGHRLGRGGGHYDRTLALLDPLALPRPRGTGPDAPRPEPGASRPLLVAVLFDGEIVPDVPVEEHDQRVGAAITPSSGIRYFRR